MSRKSKSRNSFRNEPTYFKNEKIKNLLHKKKKYSKKN